MEFLLTGHALMHLMHSSYGFSYQNNKKITCWDLGIGDCGHFFKIEARFRV